MSLGKIKVYLHLCIKSHFSEQQNTIAGSRCSVIHLSVSNSCQSFDQTFKELEEKSQLSETNDSDITMATKSFMHDAEQCVSHYHLKAAVTILDHSFGLYFSNSSMCIRNVC